MQLYNLYTVLNSLNLHKCDQNLGAWGVDPQPSFNIADGYILTMGTRVSMEVIVTIVSKLVYFT